METIPFLQNQSFNQSTGSIWKFLIGIGVLIVIGICINIAVKQSRVRATPDNIKRIQTQQLALLGKQWTGITQGKNGLSSNRSSIPADQDLLINYNVLSTRLLGYLGPFDSGVYDEDTAVRFACSSGARCFILEIDHAEGEVEPLLVYRDSWGIKRSLNEGSIEKVAKSLNARAFTPSNDGVPAGVSDDPLFLVCYFVRTPSPSRQPRDYVRFLGKVAQQLQPLQNRLMSQTPQGDFRRQAQESKLFFYPTSIFKGKIICLSNVDTSPFKGDGLANLGLKGEMNPSQDFDRMVHCRLYSPQSPSGLGVTSIPSSNIRPAAVCTTPSYWLTTPPDRYADAVAQTKQAWTLVMHPVASESSTYTSQQLKDLYTTYGVHAVPCSLMDAAPALDAFVGTQGPYRKQAWVTKPDLLRFIPPKPIVVQNPPPQANAGGGAIRAPTF